MNFVEDCLLLLGLSSGMVLAGYWLAARLTNRSPGERMAVATLAGLSTILWSVTVVNLFRPLAGFWAWVCLWPIALSLLSRPTRTCIGDDLYAVFASRRGALAATLGAIFLLCLLAPVLMQRSLVFYDGTSNNDSFFWVSAAEYLKRHTYLEAPVVSATHPLMNNVGALTGWKPVWGRMGAEGLLALVSAVTAVSTIKIYLCATAALFIPWIAAVFLVTKTFLIERLTLIALMALLLLQPLFIFFHGNANLPNLIGILMGAAVVVATEHSLRGTSRLGIWLIVLVFAFHGLVCAYPEMAPFIALPCALLWCRSWATNETRLIWRSALGVAGAFVAALALNPASTVRAWHGFIVSFEGARADQHWANLFVHLSPGEYVPALGTLAFGASQRLGSVLGAAISLGLLGVAIAVIRRARDPFGALAMMAGFAALIVYTVCADFHYGWQKSVQFSAVFCAALFPVAAIDFFARTSPARPSLRYLVRLAGGAILVFFIYATVLSVLNGYTWSERKPITQDWFGLRAYIRKHLSNHPVLIEGASFRIAFFNGMWLAYFLADNPIYFGARDSLSGGYLHDHVINESSGQMPENPPPVFIVGRDWADTFDANSLRLFSGDTVVLLRNANRIANWKGLYPENGVPFFATAHITLTLRPHTRSQLRLVLVPRDKHKPHVLHWTATSRTEGAEPFTTAVSGSAPWSFVVPLAAGKLNQVQFIASPAPDLASADPFDFSVEELRIQTLP